ncbi:uncharacterized protein LOC116012916, partial [Ipomoea triloba]|uniref:uncharacterized protein LOC116012916 n=1 Tax=Ipomoea triloba TaxID=35885 RepID=UPI00125E32D9
MKWKEIKEDFEATAKQKISNKSLKNKWDAMKKEWRTWKQLKREETGLGWDPSTHKISGSDEWWEKKIKENSEYKKFRNKSIDPAMDDLWSKLFEDSYANGEGWVAPTMDPQLVQPVDIEEENIESEEENRTRQGFEDLLYSQDNQHSSQLHDLEVDESSFWNNFIGEVNHCVGNQDVSGTQVPRQNQSNNVRKCAETQNIGLKPTQMKRKRRQSGGAAQLSSQLDSLISNSNRALDVLIGDSTVNTQSTTTVSLASAISVINRMVTDGIMEKGGDLKAWLKYNIDDDFSRKAWLKYMHDTSFSRKAWLKYMHDTSKGQEWMREVLNGHPIRCVNAFRMDSALFKQLCEDLYSKYELRSTRNMSIVEKVGIFIYTLAMGASNRDVGERFQRSGETINRAFHEVLEATSGRSRGYQGLARDITIPSYITPNDPTFQAIPSYITNDARYMPYFKDCIGCIDGTHIAACIPEADQLRYRGRKGIPTFNVMAACDFDMCFTFISVGWEGSAHDTRVFVHAISTPSMNFPKPPQGRYYLVDKGYPDKQGYLVPYPRIRYHQSQFEQEPPTNAQEAFNRAHSSLRSCIERSFGVLKKRWKILAKMPQFSVETQIDVIMATFALHNYIRKNSQDDMMFNVLEQHPDYIPPDELQDSSSNTSTNESLSQTSTEMKEIRN